MNVNRVGDFLRSRQSRWEIIPPEIHRQFRTPQAKSEDCTGFLITGKASDARLPKSRGMKRTYRYAAVTRDEGNAADDVLMVDQGPPGGLDGPAGNGYEVGQATPLISLWTVRLSNGPPAMGRRSLLRAIAATAAERGRPYILGHLWHVHALGCPR